MDIFTPILIFGIAVIILAVCGYCCKRKREGTVYGCTCKVNYYCCNSSKSSTAGVASNSYRVQNDGVVDWLSLGPLYDVGGHQCHSAVVECQEDQNYIPYVACKSASVFYRSRAPDNTTVTTTSQAAPGATPVVVPPYPVDPLHTSTGGAPAPGFTTHTTPYPPNMPYPQPAPIYYHPPPYATPYATTSYPAVPVPGMAPGYPPYPPTSAAPPYLTAVGDPHANPPPYDVAVASPPIQPPSQELYGKQSPYNPGYNN